jgi:hypothetical protein
MSLTPVTAGDSGSAAIAKINTGFAAIDGATAASTAASLAVAVESSARLLGDSNEATARVAADAVEATARAAGDDAEAAARAAGDALESASRAIIDQQLDGAMVNPRHRPGDNPWLFTSSLTGPATLCAPLSGLTVPMAYATAMRMTGASIVATRIAQDYDASRVYALRATYARFATPSDPSGDSVRVAIRWLDQNLNTVGTDTALDTHSATAVEGQRTIVAQIKAAGGTTPPTGSVYFRPYIQTFGSDGVTDILVMSLQDITDSGAYSPDLTAALARISSLETTVATLNPLTAGGANGLTINDGYGMVPYTEMHPVVLRVVNVAALRAIAPTTAHDAATQGYYAPGDKGGCRYYAVTGAGAGAFIDDGGSIILPSGGDGSAAWLALFQGSVRGEQFGIKADNATDDTAALLAFWKHAIANPGFDPVLPQGIILTSAAMPVVNVSNVRIFGAGIGINEAGVFEVGTTIKYTGAAGATMVTVAPPSSTSSQRLTGVKIEGLVLDANAATAARCADIRSVRNCSFEFGLVNGGEESLYVGIVPTLAPGEGRDTQWCDFRLTIRQLDGGGINGLGYYLDGDSLANVSFNKFWIDGVHYNQPMGKHANSDNNDYYMQIYNPGGAATKGVALLGGPSTAQCSRDEVFRDFSSTLPIHAYGTESYASPSIQHVVHRLDTGNGTPDPTYGTGASVYFARSHTPFGDTPWAAYTPIILTGTGGVIANLTARYRLRGRWTQVLIVFKVTTLGTGGYFSISLPYNATGGIGGIVTGQEYALTGKGLIGHVDDGTAVAFVNNSDGSFPGVLNGVYKILIEFESA